LRRAKRRLLQNIEENREKHARYRRDESKMVISPMELDAVIGRDKKNVVRPLYNTQYVTDCASDIIVAYGVWAQHTDAGTLVPMIAQTQAIAGGTFTTLHADSGYCSILELKDCQALGIDFYAPVQDGTLQLGRKAASGQPQIPSREFAYDESTQQMTCPAGHTMKLVREVQVPRADGRCVGERRYEQLPERCGGCPLAACCLGGSGKRRTVSRQTEQAVLDAQAAKMSTEAGKRSQRLRSQVIERRFADGKRHRGQESQNGCGLDRVKAEVGLLVVAQNTLTLYKRAERRKNQPI
jgi:hypothetical protein